METWGNSKLNPACYKPAPEQAFLFLALSSAYLLPMKSKLGPSLLVAGYLLTLTSIIFFFYHLMGARKVFWSGFTLSMVGGALTLFQWLRGPKA